MPVSAESGLSLTGNKSFLNNGLGQVSAGVNVLSLAYRVHRSKFINDFNGCNRVSAVTPTGAWGDLHAPRPPAGRRQLPKMKEDNSRGLCAGVAG